MATDKRTLCKVHTDSHRHHHYYDHLPKLNPHLKNYLIINKQYKISFQRYAFSVEDNRHS